MSDFELAKLRALGDKLPPGERNPELDALVGFATTMGEAETLIKADGCRKAIWWGKGKFAALLCCLR